MLYVETWWWVVIHCLRESGALSVQGFLQSPSLACTSTTVLRGLTSEFVLWGLIGSKNLDVKFGLQRSEFGFSDANVSFCMADQCIFLYGRRPASTESLDGGFT